MNFTSFQNWLNERAAQKLEYGCLMLRANVPNWKEKISIVKEEDLYKEGDDYGYEKEPYVTVVYGLHDDEINKDQFLTEVERLYPIKVTIDEIGVFDNDEYDVVKYNVPLVEDLKDYRKYFVMFYPNTQTYDDYHPHMTIAYVKKGEGNKYAQKVESFDVIFNEAIYSFKDEKKIFDLGELKGNSKPQK
jgi:hypothetical protein